MEDPVVWKNPYSGNSPNSNSSPYQMGCHSPSSWKNSNCDSYEETSNQTNFNLEQTNTHPIDLITRSAEDETGTTPEIESDILAQSSYEIAS